jgi:hypothetical protein
MKHGSLEMREKIARIAKPQAAFTIADKVAKILAQ